MASRKRRSSRPLAPRRARQARNTSSTLVQSSSLMRVSMVGSCQTDPPGDTDPSTWEPAHVIPNPIRPHGLEAALYCRERVAAIALQKRDADATAKYLVEIVKY